MNGVKEVRHDCAALLWALWQLVGSKGMGRGVGMRPQLCFYHSRPAFMEKRHLCLTQPVSDTVADAPFPRPLILFLVPVPGRMMPLMMRVLILLLLPEGQAAPKDGVTRPDSEVQHQLLPNPFQPGPEQLRLLQSYLKGLERTEVKPEHLSRELWAPGPGTDLGCPIDSFLLYLFALHDYDQSGQLDGLELLSMLTAALAPGAASSPTTNPVILIVDKVLETQDLNGDGLMTPAELINFPGEAPSHVEPREPLAPSPQEPQAVGRQSLLAKSPLRQETQEALGPREEAEGQVEAKRESLEPVQEPGGQAEADRDGPGPIGEAGGQAEAEDVPRPKGEDEGQVEAKENGEEAKELPGETLESRNTPNEFDVHIVQLENDEI
uniref:Cell growth regulator with EF hand domain protein 1 n=1 Tax=Aotus nancymaae TaxID=37293 RepID=A0A2K5BVD7_AOTNA